MDSDLDSDDNEDFKPKKKAPAKKPAAEKPKKPAAEKPKPAPKKKKVMDSDSEDERPAKKSKTKKKSYDDSSDGSDMDFDGADIGPARDRPGRNRKAVNYGTVEASESDSDF